MQCVFMDKATGVRGVLGLPYVLKNIDPQCGAVPSRLCWAMCRFRSLGKMHVTRWGLSTCSSSRRCEFLVRDRPFQPDATSGDDAAGMEIAGLMQMFCWENLFALLDACLGPSKRQLSGLQGCVLDALT
jgi:hypothetical protein